MAAISEFRGDYEFLSNFYHYSFYWHGHRYPTVEHAFQSAKTLDPGAQAAIRGAATASMAKRAGRRSPLRPGWEDIRVNIMRDILLAKFHSEPMRTNLLDTKDHTLVEGNYWHDNIWGVCHCGKCGGGANHLGKSLMWVRGVLTQAPSSGRLSA